METVGFILFYAAIIIVAIVLNAKKKKAKNNQNGNPYNRPAPQNRQRKPFITRSDDGHKVPPAQDLTCEGQFRHRHDFDEVTPRYIVHEKPEQGYVILDGVKRRIKDIKDL